jgi:hypothetical protein
MAKADPVDDLHKDYESVDEYAMDIEKDIVDKLGIKLYDKVSDAIAELVANSYDADAEEVTVKLPLNKYLATRLGDGTVDEQGYVVEVIDDGHGMTPAEADRLFLRVGRDRRDENGDTSREKNRPVMGRKGIGKLAPFGICNKIEIISAGGPRDADEYKVSHFKMDYEEIKNTPPDENYNPERGKYDGNKHDNRGTVIRLKEFNVKKVPDKETFSRQLGYKFANGLPDFNVIIKDTKEEDPVDEFDLGDIVIPVEEKTKIDLSDKPVSNEGDWYNVDGWMAMAKDPYKDEFGGVRIYVRGKLASITKDFGLGAGFTGEFVARSYLVGEVDADFLDEDDDLVQTHRKDIIWESDLGSALQDWGKERVKEVAKKGKEPRREKASNEFLEASDLETKAKERYGDETGISETAVELGQKFGQFAHEDELDDPDYVDDFSNFVIEIAPHKHLVDAFHELRERAEGESIEIDELIEVLEATRIAEVTSFGQVAAEKVETIDIFEEKIRDGGTNERDLQEILEEAPWLIKAEWQPVTSDETLETFREAFVSWYEDEHEEELTTTTEIQHDTKRPDFVMLNLENAVKIIEIKRPEHEFDDDDFERFERYVDAFEQFFDKNPRFYDDFPNGPEFTIIVDGRDLSRTQKRAMNNMKDDDLLKSVKSWEELLRETKARHEEFIEARREIPSERTSDN